MTPEFERILQWSGSPVATCGCGRVHYVANGDSMDEGELDHMNSLRKVNPTKYIPDNENDSISITEAGGVTAVWNCPCGWLERYESAIWDKREELIEYYKTRTEREYQEAEANIKKISHIKNMEGSVSTQRARSAPSRDTEVTEEKQ